MTKQNKSWYSKTRNINTIPIATNNLIICCGEETEPNYFKGAINYFKSFKLNTLPRFFVESNNVDPLNMANKTLKFVKEIENKKHCLLDNVWVVFDKDEFTNDNFNDAILKINSLKHNNTKFHVLWSNECFELWLLLNFINIHSALDRYNYIKKLSTYLNEPYLKKHKKYLLFN